MEPGTLTTHTVALAGVTATRVVRHADERGWETCQHDEQRSRVVIRSRRGVLRGVYVHPTSEVELSVVDGLAVCGLHDLRPSSRTYGRGTTLRLDPEEDRSSLRLPAGVAYALWFERASVHTVRADRILERLDDYACRWDDPGLGLRWQPVDPVLSARDALAGSLNALRASVAAALS